MKRLLAYSHQEFRNFLVQEDLKHWKKEAAKKEIAEALIENYKTPIHSVNIFIRIGLAIFTAFMVFAVGLMLALTFFSSSENKSVTTILFALLISIACTIILELYISSKKRYRGGVDDVLLYIAYGGLMAAFSELISSSVESRNTSDVFISLFSGIVAGICAIRYSDMLAAFVSYISFVGALLIALHAMGPVGTSAMPFAAALVGGTSYYFARKIRKRGSHVVWDSSLWVLEISALLILYASLNYFVVRSLTEELLNLTLEEGQDIPFAWVFYCTTAILPLAYIALGLKQRNRLLFRTGLVLVALSILTFKYYFSLGHHEITLTISGLALIAVCIALHKGLKKDKAGLTLKEDPLDEPFQYVDAESLVLVQTFSNGTTSGNTDHGSEFGGGAFGGGGSESSY